MLNLGRKFSPRILAFGALFLVASIMLTFASSAIYTAIASPYGGWDIPQRIKNFSSPREDEPEQFRFRDDIPLEAAPAVNAAIPDASHNIVSARPFSIQSTAIANRSKMLAIECLTAAIYYEAASESIEGQRAVAQVVLNRVRHPEYANSVCGVVFQGSERTTGCQFSFTCDGSLARRPSATGWSRAQAVAAMALAGYVEPSVGLATHYHTIWVVPYWSSSLIKLRTVGAHIFYTWAGRNGTMAAFTNRYSGNEQMPALKFAAITPILAEDAIDITPPSFLAEPAQAPSSKIGPSVRNKNETGLLIIPKSQIKSDSQDLENLSDDSNARGLIIDNENLRVKRDSGALMVDRK